MSIGYGGKARLALEDERMVVYEYAPYNLNELKYRNKDNVFDGTITIYKEVLVEPQIRQKLKRTSTGKKKVQVKRIKRDVDYSLLLKENKVKVENSQYCWKFLAEEKVGMIAMKMIYRIFNSYQEEGELPQRINISV